jgi:hypothetical protein
MILELTDDSFSFNFLRSWGFFLQKITCWPTFREIAFANIVSGRDDKFSMLVHTSGKTIEHRADKKPIEDVFQALADVSSPKFAKAIAELRKAAEARGRSSSLLKRRGTTLSV